jgi:hypothetical protein
MNKQKTSRGFALYKFIESNGNICSIQKSSAAEQDLIWLGCDKLDIQGFTPYGQPESWASITEEQINEKFGTKHINGNNRMHLSRETVSKLIPILQKFVDTGNI